MKNLRNSETFENDKITVFKTLADLEQKKQEDLINTMRSLVEPLISEMTETLGCQTLKDTLFLILNGFLAQIEIYEHQNKYASCNIW